VPPPLRSAPGSRQSMPSWPSCCLRSGWSAYEPASRHWPISVPGRRKDLELNHPPHTFQPDLPRQGPSTGAGPLRAVGLRHQALCRRQRIRILRLGAACVLPAAPVRRAVGSGSVCLRDLARRPRCSRQLLRPYRRYRAVLLSYPMRRSSAARW